MPDFTKTILQSRINYNDWYPEFDGIKEFDLQRKHVLHGRIDRDGNAIYIDDSNLDQIWTGEEGTEFAADFVCEAFDWLKNHVQKTAKGGGLDLNSLYVPLNFRARKAWRAGDLEHSYYNYLNNLYTDFVQNYLEVNRRFEEITDFESFLISFSKYMSSIASYFPLTKTGFILSYHCSPFVSGLMVEVLNEEHGWSKSKKRIQYTNDSNFLFIKKAAKKFGFMMDRNAPWRLVFNVASGGLQDKYAPVLVDGEKVLKDEKELSGAAYFMNNRGVSFARGSNHVFDTYYVKAHTTEIENLRNYLFLFYSAFYTQFGSYTKVNLHGASKGQLCHNAKLGTEYLFRQDLPGKEPVTRRQPGLEVFNRFEPLYIPEQFNKIYTDRFWLDYILKFRLLETASPHDIKRYKSFRKDMHDQHIAFGTKAALNFINDLTKGFFETKFIQEGSYWHGQPKSINEVRSESALKNIGSDAYVLTGVLNDRK